MKANYITIIILLFVTSYVLGQKEKMRTDYQMKDDCKKCHLCDTPTKANPCLILCPRNEIKSPRHSPSEGPEMITIHKIKSDVNLYGPSYFSHRLHSEMSLMSGGCSTCHHYNPPGAIVKCSYCHEEQRQREDLSKPDLKAAFHRQCQGCHDSFMDNSDCEFCHNRITNTQKTLTKKKVVHPELSMPIKLVYNTDYEDSLVTFYHSDHNRFGFECSTCHSETDCAKCHASSKTKSEDFSPHDKCSNCHETEIDDTCEKCHSNIERNPFNHTLSSSFNLMKYHNKLSCLSCHKSLNDFSGLNKDCSACHKTADGYFNHRITKLELDENHIDFECENCHIQLSDYTKISCEECHDEISYPKNIPGIKIK